jgi:hypothetical protein
MPTPSVSEAPGRGAPGGLATATAIRYVAPLREGGSLPALVEIEDGRLVVLKLRGAGQGARALVAEILAGELARAVGLPVPELLLVELDPALALTEPDPEIRDLLLASVGTNVGLVHLPGALPFDPAARPSVPGALASLVVALDAYVMNVDRTPRNPNLLSWRGSIWLIDHGAALYWHHAWEGEPLGALGPFPRVRDHVLLPWADDLAGAGAALVRALPDEVIARVVGLVPDDWLGDAAAPEARVARRAGYAEHLRARRDAAATFIEEALRARTQRV